MSKNYIANHKKGTTWDGMELFIEDRVIPETDPETFTPSNLTGVTVIANFREKQGSNIVFDFKTENNSITIPNPLTGRLFFSSRKMDVPVCTYYFDIKLIYPDGTVREIVENYWTIE